MSTNFEVPEALPSAVESHRSPSMKLFEDAYVHSHSEPLMQTDTPGAALPPLELTGITNHSESLSDEGAQPTRPVLNDLDHDVSDLSNVGLSIEQEQPAKEIVQMLDKKKLLSGDDVGKYPPLLPPPPPAPLESTEPYDRAKAEEAIRRLNDPSFRVRDEATGLLRRMGQPALADLQRAMRDDSPETRMRAGLLTQRLLAHSEASTEAKANSEYFEATRRAGTIDPSRAGNLTPEEVKAFEGHRAAADRFLTPDRLKRFSRLSEFGQKAVQDSIDIRLKYAERLLNSGVPDDRPKALSLLTQQMEVPGNVLMRNSRFLELAVRAGGDRSPDFRQAFARHGGLLQHLEKFAGRN
ncbi:MAG: hypothetical protein K2X93_17820 [Candidatus Obscuribacterales bacterium]|nr:hypothetical protein [Candidatus Obscuribacterales bacterium]